MIQPFFGELFRYPVALELSHNYCSNKCAYCFANLNTPDRKANVQGVMNQLANHEQRSDITSLLLQKKIGICLSNKTDPFAASNYQIAKPQIEILNELDIPIAYHTRGGKHLIIDSIKPTLFYISICHTDDAVRKKIEPGATTIEYRWELAKELISKGHQVVIACNPFVTEWVDEDIYIKNLNDSGVKYIIAQPIHLNNDQLLNMDSREIFDMQKIVKESMKKENKYQKECRSFIDKLLLLGFTVYDTLNFNSTNIMNAWHHGLKGKTFKTYYDFFHWCLKNKQNNEAVFFDEFYDFIKPNFLEEHQEYSLYQYITSIDRRYRKTRQSGLSVKQKMTFKELAQTIWNDNRFPNHLSRVNQFGIVGEIKNKTLFTEVDENNNLIMCFNSNNFANTLVSANEVLTF